jgi:hypothetical protein
VEISSEAQDNHHQKGDGAIPTSSSSESPSDGNGKPLPALPAPEDATPTPENGFRTVVDGTVSRIANWGEMTALERENTLRVLGKRNQLRLANLRAGLPADQKPADS